MQRRPAREAFTLIELLIVLSIIAILAALVLSTAGYVQKKSAMARTQAEIAAVSAALESYKADNGDYPVSGGAANTLVLIASLMPSNGSKVYFEFKTNSTNGSGWLDPFGNNYYYVYTNGSPNNGANYYDLWSTAGGGSSNSWIRNW